MTMSDEKGISAGTVLVSFVAGAAIGAGLALLYAPKTGSEMRETITDFTEDAVDKIKEYTKEAQEKIKTAIDDSKETIVEKKSILASAIEAGREAMQREKERSSAS
jgi:gas vesicle protein